MSKPRTANPALAISEADLASALAQIGTEVDDQPLRSSALARIMRETFHGSDAGGAWDWRMAYDLMQAAAVQVLLRGGGAAGDIAAARLLASRLLTETRRSEQQIRLQQFSTPLAFAALMVRAAAIRKGEGSVANLSSGRKGASVRHNYAARWSSIMAKASVMTHGPTPKARSTIRFSPIGSRVRLKARPWLLRRACIPSKPLIVA